MKTKAKFIKFVFITLVSCYILSFAFAQSSDPQPPPVNIQISTDTIPKVGEEVTLIIKVTPQEDMHTDISCLLPRGVRPVTEKGILLSSYKARDPHDIEREMRYWLTVELWVGPVQAGVTKEFSVPVVIPDKERYEFIARVEALAKWGVKEKVFVIAIDIE